MVANLSAGHLDGYCVGEPWNSVAVQSGAGRCLATSAELAPGHPEKVLMTRRDFAEKRPEEHCALIASILEACAFCQQPGNHAEVIATLVRPEYVGASEKALARGIKGNLELGRGDSQPIANFNVFHSTHANDPSADKAAWVLAQLREVGRIEDATRLTPSLGRRVFRSEIFQEAARLVESTKSTVIQTHDLSSESKLSIA
jgi:ABC-type nitrate/sulfonate/bicarbonate transport system substrate-binding protein